MKRKPPITVKARQAFSRYGPLMFICQRAPIGQLIVQEARVIGTSGFSQVAKWSIAVVSGLGAFDCVSGATLVKQIAPVANSASVPATNGAALNFIVQVTGAPSTAKSWKLTGTLPAGLRHNNATNSNTDSVTGVPTQNGSFPVTVTAYENAGYSGGSKSASFTISVTGGVSPPAITSQPAASTTVNAGSTAVLSVGASGTSPTFQWYAGAAGNTAAPIAGAVASTYTTPALAVTSSYWVRVANAGGGVNSGTAVVTVIQPPVISAQPVSTTINAGGTTVLSVAASGTSPSFQWYAGASGDITNPIGGATASSFTTPALAATASYWVKVTNAAGSLSSTTAVVTVVEPPVISGQPASTAVSPGGAATLSVTASGTSPVFQWYQGATGDITNAISGAAGPTFTTPALSATTSYWVRVTNPAGVVDSSTATVSVSVVDTFSSWAANRFTPSQLEDPAISGPTMDPDGDGTTNEQEFVFGTSPLAPDRSVTQSMDLAAGQVSLSFLASPASGPGYAGLTRHYALESSQTLGGSVVWAAVPGFTNIIGNGQTVNFTAPVLPGSDFYHVKVWLASE